MKTSCLRFGILGCLLLLQAACAPPPASEGKRFFWPVGDPKIEYVNFYQTRADAARGAQDWLSEAIFGRERPVPVFERPSQIASDGAGRIFVTDLAAKEVLVFDLNRHEVRPLYRESGEKLTLALPIGIALDDSGRAFVLDSVDRRIYRFSAEEKLEKNLLPAQLERPTGIVVDSARQLLYIADPGKHQVVVATTDGKTVRTLGGRGGGESEFNFPLDVSLDRQGNLYVLDSMNARIKVFDPEGNFLRAFGQRGTEGGAFMLAKSLSVSPAGQVYVTDSRAHRIIVFSLAGEHLLTFGGEYVVVGDQVAPGGLYLPEGIDVDRNNTIWVVDSLNSMFHEFQYLDEEYLKRRPILPGQAIVPLPAGTAGEDKPAGN